MVWSEVVGAVEVVGVVDWVVGWVVDEVQGVFPKMSYFGAIFESKNVFFSRFWVETCHFRSFWV